MKVGVVVFDIMCPICCRKHLELQFLPSRDGPFADGARHASIAADRQSLRLTAPGGATADAREFESALGSRSVWTTGVDFTLLASPCLLRAAEIVRNELSIATSGEAVTAVSCLIEHVLRSAPPGEFCLHGVVIDGYLCTALMVVASDRAGLISIPELSPVRNPLRLPPDLLPVETRFLEAAPDEPALTIEDLQKLSVWETTTCETPRPRLRWQHLILVSHKWPTSDSPGTLDDLAAVKQLVASYIKRTLASLAATPNPKIKARTPCDFGIWIDYMMVPNDLRHGGRTDDCPDCLRLKTEAIKRINALLTLATVLPYTPSAVHRGWILQEVSLNAHPDGGIELGHRDRVRLMQHGVEFTDIVDGARLRCYEFVRLGQMPRAWPAVNKALIERWNATEQRDEDTGEALQVLTEYARSFDKSCHRMKRVMAELTQQLALTPSTTVLDLSELASAVDDQGQAMRWLGACIAADDRPDAPSDPKGVLNGALAVENRVVAARALQFQQFAGLVTGLRAEWLRGGGLASWVWLTVVTEALGGAKFMARLKDGQVRSSEASSTVSFRDRPWSSLAERFAHTVDVATNGVPAEALRHAYR